ncbi:alternate-type signal peptide domain-containing protein [Gordonia phosphorivorans]|uniref:Alternate-type signal peptide domain-containing protein n=1 Tax=Gordonia phosphorivorans TaxID=1056982 RepID=A0ABV6HBU5_9ACTN
MNKVTKGALAAAAGAAILAGGAGTMAAWNSNTQATDGGTITAGSLNVVQKAGTGGWAWVNGTTPGAAIPNLEAIKLVPGDQIQYTATYDVTLVGQNLKAELVPTLTGVSGDLANSLTATNTGGGTVQVNQPGTTSHDVSTVVTFSPSADNDTMTKTGVLSGVSVTLTQKQ